MKSQSSQQQFKSEHLLAILLYKTGPTFNFCLTRLGPLCCVLRKVYRHVRWQTSECASVRVSKILWEHKPLPFVLLGCYERAIYLICLYSNPLPVWRFHRNIEAQYLHRRKLNASAAVLSPFHLDFLLLFLTKTKKITLFHLVLRLALWVFTWLFCDQIK